MLPRMLAYLTLAAVAAAGDLAGAVLVTATHQRGSTRLRYFVAAGAGFMLAAAFVRMLPEATHVEHASQIGTAPVYSGGNWFHFDAAPGEFGDGLQFIRRRRRTDDIALRTGCPTFARCRNCQHALGPLRPFDDPALYAINLSRGQMVRLAFGRHHIVLVLGHLLIQLVLDGGVSKIGFAFVAGRWASPFWQVWDLLMLWLAMLHGANGLRTVINDYAERANTRLWLKGLLYTATVFTILLGTLVIFTFDPNIR